MQTKLFIGGEWRDGSNGATIAVTNPATGEHIADVAAGTPTMPTAACEAADVAQHAWAAVAPREKAEILRRCWETHDGAPGRARRPDRHRAGQADRRRPRRGRLRRRVLPLELRGGRPHPRLDQHGAVGRQPDHRAPSAGRCRRDRDAVELPGGDDHPQARARRSPPATAWSSSRRRRRRSPRCGSPSCSPRPACRAGWSTWSSPRDSGDWFDAAVDHPATRMVSFTGSTAIGQMLLKRSADRVLKTVMELGGNAPFIVFDDADIDAAVEGAMVAKMRHSAETCTAANRFFVARRRRRRVHRRSSRRRWPTSTSATASTTASTCGPLINDGAVDTVDGLVDDAVAGGATVDARWRRARRPGQLLRTDRARQRRARLADHPRGDLRSGRPGHHVHRHRRDDRHGQRHRDGPDRRTCTPGPGPRASPSANASRPA